MSGSFFHVLTATHILQFSSGIVPLNFVWLWHNVLSFFFSDTTKLFVSFQFIHYPCFVDCHIFLPLFLSGTVPEWNCLCVNVTQISCVSPLSLGEYHTCVSIFFCSNVTKISMYLHYFYFVSFWVIVEPFSFLSYVGCYISFFFYRENSNCPPSFGNITNLFLALFHIWNVKVDFC